ncbi:MAG: SPOR domain-containing protein [Candidatus Omnitrophota bacterium]
MKALWSGLMIFLLIDGTAHAMVGRQGTKRERLAREAHNLGPSYTVAYEKIHESFLRDDFAGVERLTREYLSGSSNKPNREDVLYLRALSLAKLNRGEEARRKLRELESDFQSADDRAGVSTSIADTYFYDGNHALAAASYEDTLRKYPQSDQASYIRERLSEMSVKPLPAIVVLDDRPAGKGAFFTVQVGSFSRQKNAQGLVDKLNRQNYQAYLEPSDVERMFRVRVGKLASREEAMALERRLRREGYPTKIYP